MARGMAGWEDEWLGEQRRPTNGTAMWGSPSTTYSAGPVLPAVPDPLPVGATALIPDSMDGFDTLSAPWLLCEAILLGTLDLSGSGAFTQADTAPTRMWLGSSRPVPMLLAIESTSDWVSTRTFTISVKDQDGAAQSWSMPATTSNVANGMVGFPHPPEGSFTGVREVTNITMTGGASPSGTANVLGLIPVSLIPTTTAQISTSCNLIAEGVVRRLPAGAQLRLLRAGVNAGRGLAVLHYTFDQAAGTAKGSKHPMSSIAELMHAEAKHGILPVALNARYSPSTTVGNATSGLLALMQSWYDFTVPAMGVGVEGAVVSAFRGAQGAGLGTMLCWRPSPLGSCTLSGGISTFTSGTPMPSRRFRGQPVASPVATDFPVLNVTQTFSGGANATVTITYTNGAGTSGRTAVLALPNNPVNKSMFAINPHLQGTDTSILSVENITMTGQTTGKAEVVGLVRQADEAMADSSLSACNIQVTMPNRQLILQEGDVLAPIRVGTSAAAGVHICHFDLCPVAA